MTKSLTLADARGDRSNAIGFLRLAFAAAVIVSHSWPLGGFGQDVGQFGGINLGNLAVCGFFALSGYLITLSALKHSPPRFIWHRVLRLYPGFWVCLVLTAVVFAPLNVLITHGDMHALWQFPGDAIAYVSQNISIHVQQPNVGATPVGTFHREAGTPVWNGALWTLWFEVCCYLLLLVGNAAGVLRRARWSAPAVTVMFVAAAVAESLHPELLPAGVPSPIDSPYFFTFGTCFFAAASMALYADRVRLHPGFAALALAVATVTWVNNLWVFGAGVCFSYAVLYAAVALPFRRVGVTRDLSYGVYLYGFPVQQLLASAGSHGLGPLGFSLSSLVIAAGLGALSWRYVEAPAMKLRSWTPRRFAKTPRAQLLTD